MSRRRSNEENRSFWRMAIQMQRESGLSIAEFCRREGLQQATFYAWRRRLEQESHEDIGATTEASRAHSSDRLVPVDVIDDRECSIVEVVSPDGFVMRVPNEAAIDNVRRVLRLMHEVS